MTAKPSHLGIGYAEQFKEASIAAAYEHRPPTPEQVVEQLVRLVVDEPRAVLDVGCGTGAVARRLVPFVSRIDAIDFSSAMVEVGKQLPEGNHPNLYWVVSGVEDASLNPPYSLIVAASSLHWMDWGVVMPRFRQALTPNGVLAIVWQEEKPQAWSGDLTALISRYSTNQEYQPFDLIKEVTQRGHFRQQGEYRTEDVPFTQPIASYIESIHSRNGFSRERMEPNAADAFDEAVVELLSSCYPDGLVSLEIVGHVVWGEPAPIGKGQSTL